MEVRVAVHAASTLPPSKIPHSSWMEDYATYRVDMDTVQKKEYHSLAVHLTAVPACSSHYTLLSYTGNALGPHIRISDTTEPS
jgi:hypothetical protein